MVSSGNIFRVLFYFIVRLSQKHNGWATEVLVKDHRCPAVRLMPWCCCGWVRLSGLRARLRAWSASASGLAKRLSATVVLAKHQKKGFHWSLVSCGKFLKSIIAPAF